jgi:hypothetical protein
MFAPGLSWALGDGEYRVAAHSRDPIVELPPTGANQGSRSSATVGGVSGAKQPVLADRRKPRTSRSVAAPEQQLRPSSRWAEAFLRNFVRRGPLKAGLISHAQYDAA